MSPGRSLGTKLYGWPHLVQNPSVRPDRSPRPRPTAAPQSARLQNRLRSGTSACASTAVRGSGRGTSGTATRPTPSRPRAAPEDEPLPELCTDTAETPRVGPPPDTARDSRPDTERRDADGRDGALRPEPGPGEGTVSSAPAASRPVVPPASARPVRPVAGEDSRPPDETTGARPHTSQYSSPPPTSS